jgi:hypothetical protein
MEDKTMKKTYITPVTKAINVETVQMLATSVGVQIVEGEYDGQFNAPGLNLTANDDFFNFINQ